MAEKTKYIFDQYVYGRFSSGYDAKSTQGSRVPGWLQGDTRETKVSRELPTLELQSSPDAERMESAFVLSNSVYVDYAENRDESGTRNFSFSQSLLLQNAAQAQSFRECASDMLKILACSDCFWTSQTIREWGDESLPEVEIEDLPIPFTAVATDLYTGEEVLFRKGPLFDAVRASISIPSMFVPVRMGIHTLVDGGICNTFPLNRAVRTEDDILVGFNVNEIDAGEIRSYLDSRIKLDSRGAALKEEAHQMFKETLSAPGGDSLRRVKELVITGIETLREDRRLESDGRERRIPTEADENVATILDRSFGIMNCAMARQSIALTPPDILVSLPYDSYQGVAAYAQAGEIIEKGRELMSEALDRYERYAEEGEGRR